MLQHLYWFISTNYGLSRYYSPEMIVMSKVLEYKKHCMYAFGMYINAYTQNNPMNVGLVYQIKEDKNLRKLQESERKL